MTYFEHFIKINAFCGGFPSREQPRKKASNSEIRRWFITKSILYDNIKVDMHSECIFPIEELRLFPKGNTVTL